jgi:CRISPR/Cas system CSM-associated protein Csm2 small subunit
MQSWIRKFHPFLSCFTFLKVIRNEWKKSEKAADKSENLVKIKNYNDIQKNKLNKLFDNIDKPVSIPVKKEWKLRDPDATVRLILI